LDFQKYVVYYLLITLHISMLLILLTKLKLTMDLVKPAPTCNIIISIIILNYIKEFILTNLLNCNSEFSA